MNESNEVSVRANRVKKSCPMGDSFRISEDSLKLFITWLRHNRRFTLYLFGNCNFSFCLSKWSVSRKIHHDWSCNKDGRICSGYHTNQHRKRKSPSYFSTYKE